MPDIQDWLDAGRTKRDGTRLSDQRLAEVFDLVKPTPNWKYPINAAVPKLDADAEEIELAVVWFCGGAPDVTSLDAHRWYVTGAGYYEWIGA